MAKADDDKSKGNDNGNQDSMFSFIDDPDLREKVEQAHKLSLDTTISTAVEKEVSGLKSKNDELLGELKTFKKKSHYMRFIL